MQKIRSLHSYLGCIFAPMLLFFAISGIWQTLGIRSPLLEHLTSIHISRGMKVGTLTNYSLKIFIVIMSFSFIFSTILGVVMALKYGRSRRLAFWCLVFGVAFPVALILIGLMPRS